MTRYRSATLLSLLASASLLASCMPAAKVGRAPQSGAPMMVSLSPESLRALAQYSAHTPVHARLDGTLMECRAAGADRPSATAEDTRAGLYRAVAGFVAGAVITPALAAVSPRVGAAWVNVLNEFQGRNESRAASSAMLCRQVR